MVTRVRVAAALLTVVAAGILQSDTAKGQAPAQEFKSGDVFASISLGRVNVYRRDPVTNDYITDPNINQPFGRLTRRQFRLSTGTTATMTGSAFDSDGNFYVTTFVNGGVNGVYKFVKDFNPAVNGAPTSFNTGGDAPESIVIDATGNLYVGHAHAPKDEIRKFSADGQPVGFPDNRFDAEPDFKERGAPIGTDWIDLAGDQRTMYYTSEGRRIRRYDVESRTQLGDFIDLSVLPDDLLGPTKRLFAIRLLPGGRVLAADNINIKLLSADETLPVAERILRTYDVPGGNDLNTPDHNNWFSLNLDPDGMSFWSGDSGTGLIHKFDIASGARLASIFTGAAGQLFGVSVFDEPTVATRCETAAIEIVPVSGSTCGTLPLAAKLTCGGSPVPDASLTFVLAGASVGTATTGPDGAASLVVPSPPQPGSFPQGVKVIFPGTPTVAPVSAAADLELTNGMTLTVSSVSGATCGSVDLSATLMCGITPAVGQGVRFTVNGAAAGESITNAAGVAARTAVASPLETGTFPTGVLASFAGDTVYAPASGTAELVLVAGVPTLTVAPAEGSTCGTLDLSASVMCGGRPLPGRSVSFLLNGLAAGTALTNAEGVATRIGEPTPPQVGTFATGVASAVAGDSVVGPGSGVGLLALSAGVPTLTAAAVEGTTCSTLNLNATLTCGLRPIDGQSISFALNGAAAGAALTNAAGLAVRGAVPAPAQSGTFSEGVLASFAGNAVLGPAVDTAGLALVNGCRPALALTKTADPTAYTSLGEAITYKYVLTNTGQVSLSSPFTITDDKLGSFACSTDPSLPVNASLTCTKPYAIQANNLGSMATPPRGVPATINTGFWLHGVVSTQDTSIGDAAGVVDGVYPGWCIQHGVPRDLRNQRAKLYSSVGVPLPADAAGLPWNEINYLLNHKIRGPGTTDLDFFKDVQTAIWMLLGETSPIFEISPEARQMVAEANAHPGFVPGPTDVLAVLVYSDGMGTEYGSVQESIIELKPFQSITNHAVATALAGTVTVQSNEAQATVRQVLQNTSTGLMDTVATGRQAGNFRTATTRTFSTSVGNELLLAFISADYVKGPNTTVTGVGGAGLTWELVTRANGQRGTAEIWRAFSYTPLTNVAVTASLSQRVSSSITVVSFKNVDTSGSNGSGAIGAVVARHARTGAPTARLTTTRNNSWVFAVGTDWDNAIARTPAPAQAIVHQYLAPIGDTYWVQRTAGAVPLAGSVVTMKDVAPTNGRWNFAAVEILPSAAPPALGTVPNVVELTSGGASR